MTEADQHLSDPAPAGVDGGAVTAVDGTFAPAIAGDGTYAPAAGGGGTLGPATHDGGALASPADTADSAGALAAARFRRLFDDHFRTVIGYALRRCANPSDAADVAAEVFLTAWRRLDDCPTDDPLPWLIGTARGTVANLRRGQLRRHRLADRLRDDLAVNPPLSPGHPDVHPVTAAMARLSRSDRELLRLIAWEGLTPIQIAALDGVPASTIRSRLRRARARLASALAAERYGPVPSRDASPPTGTASPMATPTHREDTR